MKLVLEVIEGPHAGTKFTFEQHETFLAGRDQKADLPLTQDRHFSRHHFLLEINPPWCYLRDLDSRNGTYLNEGRSAKPCSRTATSSPAARPGCESTSSLRRR